jgi:DNA excision repair protein ERCC-5
MGVTGLWTVLQPCARPTRIETLNRKRLAVDASIWIYQFLKAVRDKEGNALRNSHVVGFFRRICKLLFFGIKPVFVFDGGAPILKRQTILGRKRRREGRRDDAVRTAGKLLALQMQRRAEQEEEKRKREVEVRGRPVEREEEEELPENLVYVDEIGMSNQERQQTRKFMKKDAYHLPDLNGSIENMGQPDDPRIMSIEELQEFARQQNSGENIDFYDFSKIDFDGEFFKSLPAADRYNILNAARLRSRLRMGLSKEQLEEMFPDRMAFSRFQIERVRERNELTQRLMNLNGMNGEDGFFGVGRVIGERGREYILVKNEGVEGGWALGVVSKDKDEGERSKPIDIDALHERVKKREQMDEEWEDEDDFEDVPIEGLNRLPTLKGQKPVGEERYQSQDYQGDALQNEASSAREPDTNRTESLFVEENDSGLFVEQDLENEDEQLNRAIALSLQNQFGSPSIPEDESTLFEDVPMPTYEQKAVEEPKPIITTDGKMVAHIVNNRANASIPKRQEKRDSSDDEMDFQSALAAARKYQRSKPAPVPMNVKNPFEGPLPFEKFDLSKSIFGRRSNEKPSQESKTKAADDEADEMAGGFERSNGEEEARPLPPWLVESGDIRSNVREQQAKDLELNAQDRERAIEEEKLYQREHGIIAIESSDEDSDIEILDAPPPIASKAVTEAEDAAHQMPNEEALAKESNTTHDLIEEVEAHPQKYNIPENLQRNRELPAHKRPSESPEAADASEEEFVEWSESDREDGPSKTSSESPAKKFSHKDSPSVNTIRSIGFSNPLGNAASSSRTRSPSPVFEDIDMTNTTSETLALTLPAQELSRAAQDTAAFDAQKVDMLSEGEFDEFSDPEDEELLAQLAIEAEEHARFASTLNNKSAKENIEAYEHELKQLRNQQKKDRRDADEVSQVMITECQALLRLFGLPYITAPMEAEAQCAELVDLGLVDGIVTDDSDIFLFGGTRVFKNMFNSNKFVECYLSADLEKELSLSRDELINIAQLLGSDYTEGLPGIGPVTALEIISEFPTDNGLQEFKDWWADVQMNNRPKEADSKSTFRKKFRRSQATKLFLPPGFPSRAVTEAYLKPEVDSTPDPFQWGVPDLDNLRSFLMSTIGWSQERTDEVLVPVIRDMNRRETEGTQTNITRYFEGGIGVGARGGFAPRVREAGSARMKDAVQKLKARTKASAEMPTAQDNAGQDNSEEESRAKTLQVKPRRDQRTKRMPANDGDDNGEEDFEDDANDSDDKTYTQKANTKTKRNAPRKRVKVAA